ncbi:uncharacterized protein LOC114575841, partial [Exaiptasia diaphana]|uniref:Response regulatory domain-containing protein n=1 Tax=Exaiptasia diaphana TaxID=2652724 RepID=A0A913YQ26_EXADI
MSTPSHSPTGERTISVAIVDDDSGVREGLAYLIGGSPGLACVGTYPTAEAFLAAPRTPDVVLMDIDLPGLNGIEAVRRLKQNPSPPLAIMLTVYEDDEQIFDSLRAGACGYLLKTTPPAELVEAIT